MSKILFQVAGQSGGEGKIMLKLSLVELGNIAQALVGIELGNSVKLTAYDCLRPY